MKITEASLNIKIMSLLRERQSCVDARSVMLELVNNAEEDGNWRIGHFDPGNGDRYACKIALRAIQDSLCHKYEMVGYS